VFTFVLSIFETWQSDDSGMERASGQWSEYRRFALLMTQRADKRDCLLVTYTAPVTITAVTETSGPSRGPARASPTRHVTQSTSGSDWSIRMLAIAHRQWHHVWSTRERRALNEEMPEGS
jgi:hypothetical protein